MLPNKSICFTLLILILNTNKLHYITNDFFNIKLNIIKYDVVKVTISK